MSNLETIYLEDGKYEIENSNGLLTFRRNGKAWEAANDLKYSKVVLLLVQEVLNLQKQLQNKQYIIDNLMLEYCPDEMTPDQIVEWGKHQVAHKGDI